MPVNRFGREMKYDTSASQRRSLDLLGIAYNPRIARWYASDLLTSSGVPGDGVPPGHTWRSAAKLSDAELLGLLDACRESARQLYRERVAQDGD